MEICFITGTLGRGGAERQLVYMLKALTTEGLSVRVLCLTRGEAYEEEIRELGIELDWVGASPNRVIRALSVIDQIRKRPPNILQSSHFYTNIYAAAAGRAAGIPSIGAIRSNLVSELGSDRIFGKLQFRLPKHLIVNSISSLEAAIGLGIRPRNIDLVRNVVQLQGECPPGRKVKEAVTITFVGRLVPVKNPEMFVRLAIRLLSELPKVNLRFQIIGDGPLRKDLERIVSNHGYSKDRIVFRGELTEMSETYCGTDILVLTSHYEGTPNVVLEALAFGIPVVATRVGGVPEVLSADCGTVVDPSDIDGLTDAVKSLLDDPERRAVMGANGQQFTVKNHSLKYLGNRLTGIYTKLLGGNRQNG